jgi:hypothetical protein
MKAETFEDQLNGMRAYMTCWLIAYKVRGQLGDRAKPRAGDPGWAEQTFR